MSGGRGKQSDEVATVTLIQSDQEKAETLKLCNRQVRQFIGFIIESHSWAGLSFTSISIYSLMNRFSLQWFLIASAVSEIDLKWNDDITRQRRKLKWIHWIRLLRWEKSFTQQFIVRFRWVVWRLIQTSKLNSQGTLENYWKSASTDLSSNLIEPSTEFFGLLFSIYVDIYIGLPLLLISNVIKISFRNFLPQASNWLFPPYWALRAFIEIIIANIILKALSNQIWFVTISEQLIEALRAR